jgi:hypothetical protein
MSQVNPNNNDWVVHPIVSTLVWLIGGTATPKHKSNTSHKEKGLSWRDEMMGGQIADYIQEDRKTFNTIDESHYKSETSITRKTSLTSFAAVVCSRFYT